MCVWEHQAIDIAEQFHRCYCFAQIIKNNSWKNINSCFNSQHLKHVLFFFNKRLNGYNTTERFDRKRYWLEERAEQYGEPPEEAKELGYKK